MRNRLLPGAFALALLALPVLGYFQYRWIDRVNQAELQAERTRLAEGLGRTAAAFDAEIVRAAFWFSIRPDDLPDDGSAKDALLAALENRMQQWNSGAQFPQVVQELLVRIDGQTWRIPRRGKAEPASSVPELSEFGGGPGRSRSGSVFERDGRTLVMVQLFGRGRRDDGPPGDVGGGPPPFGFGGGHRPSGPGPGLHGRPFRGGPGPWERHGPPHGPDGGGGPHGPPPTAAVVLDDTFLAQTLLPKLAGRALGPGSFALAVRSEGKMRLKPHQPSRFPVIFKLLSFRGDCLIPAQMSGPRDGGPGPPRLPASVDVLRLPVQDCHPLPANSPQGLWTVSASMPESSTVAVMNSVRTRNLLISFGVLACLAGAIAALWLSTRRASELAQRHMEFAMAVSHELRTPLTVMRLAGDNLARGVASNPDQVRRYGETIGRESERLAGMVEQILTFARSQRPEFVVRPEPVDAGTVVDHALNVADPLLSDAGFTVLREVAPDLPLVCADLNLAVAALSNLLVNAVRHGASGKWLRVRASAADGKNIAFEVADRGPGISKRDQKRIFRPFYRGTPTGATQGTGLGLHLVKRIAEAHHGAVRIESQPGAGTTATILLPAATEEVTEQVV